jgi:hypothetical protein
MSKMKRKKNKKNRGHGKDERECTDMLRSERAVPWHK